MIKWPLFARLKCR